VEEEEEEDATGLAGAGAGEGAPASSARAQPVLAVKAAGQATCVNDTLGLSAPMNQSFKASGKLSQEDRSLMPPYWAPQPALGAPHSLVQPLKIPTPPPGICDLLEWFMIGTGLENNAHSDRIGYRPDLNPCW
jgi:hypothetical protein